MIVEMSGLGVGFHLEGKLLPGGVGYVVIKKNQALWKIK